MKELPDPEIYKDGLLYWPYKKSWEKVLEYLSQNIPKNTTTIDIMCGPGDLLGKIHLKRKDIKLTGLDIDERYISYARKKHPKINFKLKDILSWETNEQYDVVICTGSIHHIPYDKQKDVIEKIASLTKPGGFALISDCYIDDYSNEIERKTAAAKLGYEYLKETIANGAPNPVTQFTIEILWNDVLMKEFKTSLAKRLPLLKIFFNNIETLKTWPAFESGYGDYISICKKRTLT